MYTFQKKNARSGIQKRPGIFIGYSDGIDGFRVWIRSENQVIRSKSVVFESETTVALFPEKTDYDPVPDATGSLSEIDEKNFQIVSNGS